MTDHPFQLIVTTSELCCLCLDALVCGVLESLKKSGLSLRLYSLPWSYEELGGQGRKFVLLGQPVHLPLGRLRQVVRRQERVWYCPWPFMMESEAVLGW